MTMIKKCIFSLYIKTHLCTLSDMSPLHVLYEVKLITVAYEIIEIQTLMGAGTCNTLQNLGLRIFSFPEQPQHLLL